MVTSLKNVLHMSQTKAIATNIFWCLGARPMRVAVMHACSTRSFSLASKSKETANIPTNQCLAKEVMPQ